MFERRSRQIEPLVISVEGVDDAERCLMAIRTPLSEEDKDYLGALGRISTAIEQHGEGSAAHFAADAMYRALIERRTDHGSSEISR